MTDTAYDWNAAMGSRGLAGGGLMGSWFAPQQTMAAAMPMAAGPMSMPTSADLGWSMPAQTSPFAPSGTNTQFASGFDGGAAAMPAGGGGGITGWLGNGQNLNAVMQGIGALTSAWLGYQNLRVAKDQLSFQKDAFAKNYGSQVKSYNTSLEDRIRGRTADYTGKEADVQAYLSKHKLGG